MTDALKGVRPVARLPKDAMRAHGPSDPSIGRVFPPSTPSPLDLLASQGRTSSHASFEAFSSRHFAGDRWNGDDRRAVEMRGGPPGRIVDQAVTCKGRRPQRRDKHSSELQELPVALHAAEVFGILSIPAVRTRGSRTEIRRRRRLPPRPRSRAGTRSGPGPPGSSS